MKSNFLLSIFILVTSAASAQNKEATSGSDKISFGIRGGLASYNMRGDAVDNLGSILDLSNGLVTTKSRTGFYGGLYVSIPLSPDLSLEPALYYTQKGYELTGNLNLKGVGFLGASAKTQLQADYIDIPLLLKLKAGSFQVFAGPQFSYLSKASLHSTAGLLGINLLNNDIDVTNNFNRWDAAVTGGLGVTISKNFNITASYDYGLQKTDAGQRVKSYNQGFKLGLGVGF